MPLRHVCFRSVTRIIRRRALRSSRQKTWRPRERPSHGFRAFVMRRNPVDSGADRGMRAYVTSGCTANDDARATRGARAQRPHAMACGELKARGTRAARRSCTHAPPVGGTLGVGLGNGRRRLRCSAGARQLRWQRSGTRGRALRRATTLRRSRHPEVAPGRTDPASSAEPVRRLGRVSVRDRGNRQRCSVALEEPGARVKHEHRATPHGMSADRPPPGTTTPPSQGRRN